MNLNIKIYFLNSKINYVKKAKQNNKINKIERAGKDKKSCPVWLFLLFVGLFLFLFFCGTGV
jgi:hypothetical protein